MGVSSFSDFAASLERVAKNDLPAATVRSVTEATQMMTATVLVEQGRAVPSGRLSGVGANGAAIGVRGTVKGHTGLVRAVGPAHLVDHDTHNRDGSVRTHGKFYFEAGVDIATPKVAAIFDRNASAALLKVLE